MGYTERGPKKRLIEIVNDRPVIKGFTQSICEITQMGANAKIIIDNVCSNCPRRLVDTGVTFNGDSDLNMIWPRMRNKNMDLKRNG